MAHVSIGITTYNRESFLRQGLKSIARQCFKDIEVIIFDNASPYNIVGLIAEFPELQIRLERVPINIGAHQNFRRAFAYAYQSPYVVIFHDDDTMHPELISRAVAVLDAHPEVCWVGSQPRFTADPKAMELFVSLPAAVPALICSVPNAVRKLMSGFHLCYDSVMYRREVLRDPDPFDAVYGKWADRPFMFAMAESGSVALLPAPLVNYRVHPSQDSAQGVDTEAWVRLTKLLFRFYRDQLLEPLTAADRRLWYRFTTNNLIASVGHRAQSWQEFFQLVAQFRPDFFNWQYINTKGIFYMLRHIKKFL